MKRAILAVLMLISYHSLACDSPHRRPPVDADADADADGPDADTSDDGDVVDVPDFDMSDGWPPRENCEPTPQNGVSISGNDYFFSVPYSTWGITLSLGETGYLFYDSGRVCDLYNEINVWRQEILKYDLFEKLEQFVVLYPASQNWPYEYNGRVFFNTYYTEYQPGVTGNPWEGTPNIWVVENGIPQPYSTWCQPGYGCLEKGVSKSGMMYFIEYDLTARPLLVRMKVHDINTQETRLIDDQHEAPIRVAIGDLAVFWNNGPCGAFRYYDIERDLIVENPSYNVGAAIAWGKYIAWDNCVPSGSYVLDVENGEVRILDEELNLDPDNEKMSLQTGYENLVALVDRARDVPEPGTATHLWLYDLDTRVERRITSEAASWYWGLLPIINCEWAIVTLAYGKNGTNVEHYLRAAMNLQQAGILDENCHIIPGPPIEFTLEEFITASGFTLEGYDPVDN